MALISCSAAASQLPAAQSPESPMPNDEGFTLSSPNFPAGGAIPRQFTCDGQDVSPVLMWEGAPDRTAALALIVDDPDASGFVHWVAFDLTGSASGGLPEGVSSSPDAPMQGRNDFGRNGWGGPCPPSGEHRYRFTLYALDQPLAMTGTPTARQLRDAMNGHVIGQAELLGRYRRGS